MKVIPANEAMDVLRRLVERCQEMHESRWALKRLWVIGSLAAGKPTCKGVDVLIETGLHYPEKQLALIRKLKEGMEKEVMVYSRDFPPNWGVKKSKDPWALIDSSPKHKVWESPLA